jgi:hypothetical protein
MESVFDSDGLDLLDAAPDGIIIIDVRGQIVLADAAHRPGCPAEGVRVRYPEL